MKQDRVEAPRKRLDQLVAADLSFSSGFDLLADADDLLLEPPYLYLALVEALVPAELGLDLADSVAQPLPLADETVSLADIG